MVITWHRRPELRKTLARNAEWLRATAGYVVATPGEDNDELRAWLRDTGGNAGIVSAHGAFGCAKYANLGIGFTPFDAPLIFVLDADIVMAATEVSDMVAATSADRAVILHEVHDEPALAPLPGTDQLGIVATRDSIFTLRLPDGRQVSVTKARQNYVSGAYLGPGMIMVGKDMLTEVGGYRSAFRSWGWEDIDLLIRLKLAGYEIGEAGRAAHLTHGDDVRNLPAGTAKMTSERDNEARGVSHLLRGETVGTLAEDIAAAVDTVRVDTVSD
ncbi:galactosyltransferase-related protein [Nocardia sp. NBC_01009]|uniref:galactosyltransferase-related protein n=1 Tax=Nocardia sp. NBC_01009 TaxID=2975996 RepID=UPI003868BBFD|nr:galactosyltransferase-related protein [Nocardia sp. NBC_01009]